MPLMLTGGRSFSARVAERRWTLAVVALAVAVQPVPRAPDRSSHLALTHQGWSSGVGGLPRPVFAHGVPRIHVWADGI